MWHPQRNIVNSSSLLIFFLKAHEVLCLEMLTLLLERPTDDSIEVAIGFLKESGLKLTEVSPRGINGKYNEPTH